MSAAHILALKWLLYPGVNLHARERYRRLPSYFGKANPGEVRHVLDAGCGNGMLSYQSYRKGNHVLGISTKENEIDNCRSLFHDYLELPSNEIHFELGNLYDIELPKNHYDEIICTEVLEHIRDDAVICRKFWRSLKPGGILHVTAPNSAHPYNAAFPIDARESGGHVRAGYQLNDYQDLLEPIGFRIEAHEGLGGPARQFFNRHIKETQERFGAMAGVPIFFGAIPCLVFESRQKEQAMPFSIYVRAIKKQ